MENSLLFTFLTLGVVFSLVKVWLRRTRLGPSRVFLPPGPKPWPVIGNIFDIPRSQPWIKVAEWRKVYGDVVHVSLLGKSSIFLNSIEAVNDLLDKRSSIYSDRPRLVMLNEIIGWDWALVLISYGSEWRKQRKLFHSHFTSGGAKQYRPYHTQESRLLLSRLVANPESFEYQIRHMVAAVLMRITYGIQIKESDDIYLKAAEEAAESMIQAGIPGRFIVDFIPLLKLVPKWFPGAGFQRMGEVWRKKVIYAKTLPFQATKNEMEQGQAPPSAVLSMLQDIQGGDGESDDEEERIKNVAGVAYTAGIDTASHGLQFFILAMSLHPEVQRKAQNEIDIVVGNHRLPTFDDVPSLPYIRALLLEVLRWHPVAPFAFAHSNAEDDEYKGFFIPKGTIILANAWALLHDETIYVDPLSFNPERFLDKNGQLNRAIRSPLEIAFGFGRRRCPGSYLAEDIMTITILSILAVFNISPKVDKHGQVIPIREEVTVGLVSSPVPFQCSIEPRSDIAAKLIHQ